MKVYVNRKPVTGPWGGGNKTLSTLVTKLSDKGIKVTFDLNEKDIDVIFCMDPRPNNDGIWYGNLLDYKNKNGAKIIQRVGDVGTHSKPDLTQLLKEVVNFSDMLIFPSDWARKYIVYEKDNYQIIHNGPLAAFYNHRNVATHPLTKVKLVTHHWSTNEKKGFDVYQQLGNAIETGKLLNVSLDYIGRYPQHRISKGITYHEPTTDDVLAKMLPKYDIYLTASLEEAGANHVLEAMAAGLPVIYRKDGGSIEEYCIGRGTIYDHSFASLVRAINHCVSNFENIKKSILNYQDTIDEKIDAYIKLIVGM